MLLIMDTVDIFSPGSASQKGTVMGILRSLGALARALGPVVSSSSKEERQQYWRQMHLKLVDSL